MSFWTDVVSNTKLYSPTMGINLLQKNGQLVILIGKIAEPTL
jgi:hypothetical protein